jgi:hypothetical protein
MYSTDPGSTIGCSELHLANANSSIRVSFEFTAKVTTSRAEGRTLSPAPIKHRAPIFSIDAAMQIDFRFLHPPNVRLERHVNFEPGAKSTDSRAIAPSNDLSVKVVTDAGIVIVVASDGQIHSFFFLAPPIGRERPFTLPEFGTGRDRIEKAHSLRGSQGLRQNLSQKNQTVAALIIHFPSPSGNPG